MAKEYRVWIEIEEHDTDTDEYETLDAPGASVAMFDTYDEAIEFAGKLQDVGDTMAGESVDGG